MPKTMRTLYQLLNSTSKIAFVLFLCFIVSCKPPNKQSTSSKSRIKTKDELYKEASLMKGLSTFIIGKTTIKDLVKVNKEIKKDKRYDEYMDYEFALKEKINVPAFDVYECPDVDTYKIAKYYVGDIEIQYIELSFYKKVLYKIECWTSDELNDAFTKKYGTGVKVDELSSIGAKENEHLKSKKFYIWENDSIITTYDSSIEAIGNKVLESTNKFTILTKTETIAQINECVKLETEKQTQIKNKVRDESIKKL